MLLCLRVASEGKFSFVCFQFQIKVTEYVLDENDQLMPMNRLHGENTVSTGNIVSTLEQ